MEESLSDFDKHSTKMCKILCKHLLQFVIESIIRDFLKRQVRLVRESILDPFIVDS